MDARLVAADASPLIGQAAAGAFGVLHKLFGTVTVAAVVPDDAGDTRAPFGGSSFMEAAPIHPAPRTSGLRQQQAPLLLRLLLL